MQVYTEIIKSYGAFNANILKLSFRQVASLCL